ncbi:transmembrane protein 236-like [Branchiostoma floridae]|uniref:Transmembrane protein 236-like n=1 Tax=Branchiostoma floridae TaxID=7739 RepID=C3Z041_BRAFL|nr:transmembrane protein 236-like [Branchiostoma floridae]|eukprot:XP_002598088.1 hypothetical protein BRAFLDRAFT_85695 [Branchiostoma floridae]
MYTPNGGSATIPNGRASTSSEFHPPERRQIRVTKVKVINFLLELCQWSSLAVPIFVTSEGVARTVDRIQAGNTTTGAEQGGGSAPADQLPYYWLLVAASIAYVATVTLLIYLPVKYCFMWKNRFLLENAKWLPAMLMHLLLSVLPCMSLMLFGIKLQDDNNEVAAMFDTYTDFPVALVVLGVLAASWVEKVRRFPIATSAAAEMTEGPSSPRSMVNPVYTIDGADGTQSTDEQTPRDPSPSTPHTPVSIRRSFPMSFSSRTSPRPKPKLTSNDDRARILSIEFFAVYDVIELLLVTNFHDVCRTYWIFPIYVVAFISMFKSILRLDHRFLPLVSMATHEIPFLILRIALLAKFGIAIMSLVYPLKNLAAIAFYVYYNFVVVIIKSRAFNKNRYSFPNRDDAVSTTSFSTISSRPGSTLY